jgi:hypothetical protein
MFVCSAGRFQFKAIVGSDMRPFFAILGLLLCLIATRADDPLVIKDSKAVRYVGKNVEVRGFVVSVTTSPIGTAIINFGQEYPNQTFAGFIAADSKMADDRIAALEGKIISITGTIELDEGKPEIKVTSPDQIKGLDSAPGAVNRVSQ